MAVNGTPLRRRKRTWLIALLLLPFILVFVGTRSFVLSPVISNILSNKFGVNIHVGGSSIGFSGNVTLHDVTLKANGITGPASEVVTLSTVDVQFDSVFPFGAVGVESVEVEAAIVRIAESSMMAGDFNFLHLVSPKESEDVETSSDETKEGVMSLLPKFTLGNMTVESGVMSYGMWVLDNKQEFKVEFALSEHGVYECKINDVHDNAQPEISLLFSDSELHLNIEDISFQHSVLELLPRTVRVWCDETDFGGGLKSFSIDWAKGQGVAAEADVQNIQFVLPEEHGMQWAHYEGGEYEEIHGKVLLDVTKGTIVYDGHSVALKEIEGDLYPSDRKESVAFGADITISDLPSIGEQEGKEWMETMLASAPFVATFYIEDFKSTEVGGADLPLVASKILSLFQLEDWDMDTKITIERLGHGGDIGVSGDLRINGASGTYEGFSYPLRNIVSGITFVDDLITIEYLNAKGSNGSSVHVSGNVQSSQDDLEVSLNIHSQSAPLDDALRDALPESVANVMDKLLDKSALKKMMDVLPGSDFEGFSLGGAVILDLKVFHDSKVSDSVEVTGEIIPLNVGIIHDVFSYPVTLLSGKVFLKKTGIFISDEEKIRFTAPGGGDGILGGSIVFEEDGFASPDLKITLENEDVNPVLVEAASFSSGDSHNLAFQVLTGLGLESKLLVEGNVKGNVDHDIDTLFNVKLLDGTARLQQELAEAIYATGPFWPLGFEFLEVEAEVVINNGVITVTSATCECGSGSVTTTMTINKDKFELRLNGSDLPISSRFVDVLPPTASDSMSNAWCMLDPGGYMDAEIKIDRDNNETQLFLDIQPKELTVSGNEETVDLNLIRGSIVVENTNVFLNDLQFQLQRDGLHEGTLQLDGGVHGKVEEFTYEINAQWSDAVIDSPLTRAITGIVGGELGIEYYDSILPTGMASATLKAHSNELSNGYMAEISPSQLTANLNNYTAVAVFDDAEEGENIIRFTDDGISFENLDALLGNGEFTIDTSSESDRTINLTWSGPSDDDSLFAVLPKVVVETLDAIEMSGGQSELNNGVFTLIGDKWSDLDVRFEGDIELEDVSIDVGVPLKEIQGNINVDATYDNKELSELTLELRMEEMSVLGRPLTDVSGKMVKKNERLVFEELGGESTTGGVALDGWVAIGESKKFEIEVFVTGARIAAKEGDDALASLDGELTGWLSVAGERGDAQSRRGSGLIRVRGGLLELDSAAVKAMQLMNFALPTSRSITGADIDLYIIGDTIEVDKIKLMGDETSLTDLVLTGVGTVDIDTFTLNARLHPRVGLPIIREITGAVNDQLYSIDVTGELFNPTISIVPLPYLSSQDK